MHAFSVKMSEGVCISGPILMAKANTFAKGKGDSDFKCTITLL